MGRSPCYDENGLKKGPWTPEEDQKLVDCIQKHGHGSWRVLPKLAGLNRCGKSCRLRWANYLRPDIKRGKFSPEEEQTILNLHSIIGNKWSAIAKHLPGRTDNDVKNFWNTHLKKKLIQMGFDPMTHRPQTDVFAALAGLLALASLCDQSMNLQCLVQSASTAVAQTNCQELNSNIPAHHQDFNSMRLVPDSDSPSTLNVQGFDGLMHNEIQPMWSNIDTNQGSSSFNNGSLLSQGENNISSSQRTPLLVEGLDLPLLADVSIDGGTSTSGGGTSSSFWPELLLDDAPFVFPFMDNL